MSKETIQKYVQSYDTENICKKLASLLSYTLKYFTPAWVNNKRKFSFNNLVSSLILLFRFFVFINCGISSGPEFESDTFDQGKILNRPTGQECKCNNASL